MKQIASESPVVEIPSNHENDWVDAAALADANAANRRLSAEVANLEKRHRNAVEALRKFGGHSALCQRRVIGVGDTMESACQCGFAKALFDQIDV